jgi:hypothetical protein
MRQLRPHSRPDKLQIVYGRRSEAQLMKRVRNDLTAHLGGRPSATQRMIIDRCATLSLRIHLMDRAELQSNFLSEKNAREYLCWTSALSRLLRMLGLEAAPERAPSLAEIMQSRPRSMGSPDAIAA